MHESARDVRVRVDLIGDVTVGKTVRRQGRRRGAGLSLRLCNLRRGGSGGDGRLRGDERRGGDGKRSEGEHSGGLHSEADLGTSRA